MWRGPVSLAIGAVSEVVWRPLPDVQVPPALVPTDDEAVIPLFYYGTDSIRPIDILMELMDNMVRYGMRLFSQSKARRRPQEMTGMVTPAQGSSPDE